MQPTKKTFQNEEGRWIERRKKSEIFLCPACGTKYLKTRKNQSTCIPCIYRSPVKVEKVRR